MIVVYNVLLCMCLISVFVVGGILYKKSPSVFIKMDNILTVNSLLKYMFGKIPSNTISLYMERKLEFIRSPSLKYKN